MKRTFKIIIRQILFLLLAGICFSCVKEDLDICPPPIDPDPNPDPYEVRFSFTYPRKNDESGAGFDPGDIQTIQVYVFNEENRFIGTFTDHSPDLADKDYYTSVSLEPGTYSFIVYGNLTECYQTEPEVPERYVTRLDEISYYYNNGMNKVITTHPEHLFYSSLRDLVISKSIDHYILPLVRNTYLLNFTAEGLPENQDHYQFVITDSNWKYQFDNSFLSCEELDYVQDCSVGSSVDQYTATFTTLRLDKERTPRLKLYNKKSGALLYQDHLIPLILKIEEQGGMVDFSEMYEFDIHLIFETDPVTGNLTVAIHINGWNVIEKEVTIEWG